ncbi:hypothetical protein V8C34DRAFT_15632 [Trichoderma compactum]
MKYSVAAVSAFVAVALAKPEFLNSAFQVQEGKPFTLEYSGCSSGCEIVLQTGASTDLKDVKVLASSATGSSTTVTLEDIPSGIYSFKITDKSGQSNYSQQFSYQGSGTAVPSASSTSSAASSAAETTSTKASSTKEHSTTLGKSTTAHSTTEEASSTTARSSIPPKNNSTTVAPTNAATTTTGRQTTAASTSSNPAITTVPPGSAAGRLSSPLALVAGVALAIAFFS